MGAGAAGLTLALAAVAALAPWPPSLSALLGDVVYPALQTCLTSTSNLTGVPLMEALCSVALFLWLVWTLACWRTGTRGVARWMVGTVAAASSAYLWFLLVWGHHYRAPALETRLPGFDASRVTPSAVRSLAEAAVQGANRWYGAAHTAGFPETTDVPPALMASWHRVEADLGRMRRSIPSTPKRPLMTPYLRAVGISGLLAPFFLETYMNPDLTPPERPAVLAHEWAHLSGFAREDDASFAGVLTALGADAPSKYSAWLMLIDETAAHLQPVTRALVLETLAEGPRRDLQAVRARQRTRIAWLDRAAWGVYDRALRSQGATEGVGGYGRVVVLLIGSGRLSDATGRDIP